MSPARLSALDAAFRRACFGVYAHDDLSADADRSAAGVGSQIDELLERAVA